MIRFLMLFLASILAGGVAAQGMDTQLQSTFHSMSNTTNPQFSGDGRPTASMGSFSFRTPVTRPQLLSYDPPRFSGGCAGIDLYGGSFSFVSKEELQGLMRQIAANAKSYAFNLALGAVCNKCLQEMQGLQDKVQKINQMMKSSCDIGQALVNSAVDPLIASQENRFQKGAQAARQGGSVSDLWESMNQGWGKESTESALARERPDELARIEPGNVVWRLLKERGVGQWFEASDDQLMLDIQSFLGTVIICAPNDTSACTAGEVEPEDRPREVRSRKLAGVLDFETLVLGNSGRGTGASQIACGDMDRCLDARVAPGPEARVGLKTRILHALRGDPESGALGYIDRARLGTVDARPEDLALRSNAPSQMGILDLAIDTNKHAAYTAADVIAEGIAVEIVSRFLGDVLATVKEASAQLGAAEAAQIGALAEDADRRMQAAQAATSRRQEARIRTLEGLGLTMRLSQTPDLRAGSIAPAGN